MPSNMRSDKRPIFGPFNLKTITAAVASALVFSNAYAAGLGKLTVLSALGQPLRAEIELTSVAKDEVGALSAKLASAAAFKQANIEFNSALNGVRFSVEHRGERQFIRVSSALPLNEPFVDMLLELSGPNGRLVREYTFLLDPADLRTSQSAQVAPAPVPGLEERAVASQPLPQAAPAGRTPRKESAPRVARPAEAKTEAAAGEYRVRSGDTLARIASQVKPAGVSLDQMLVALYQSNSDAFVGNNMNRLKAGKILSVPDEGAVRGVSAGEARGIVVAQAADFNAYRNKLAGQVSASTAQQSAESGQSAGGKITAKVEERATPASEAKDKLKLSNAPAAAGAEDKIAKDKAVAEANARVKELEKNVGELQKLLEVKSKSLAEQQKQTDAAKIEAKPAAPTSPAVVPTPADASPAKPAEAAPQKPVAPPVAAKPKPAAPPPEPSFLDELTDNPFLLPGIGALLVALGALGIYRARRQKQGKPFDDSIIADSSLKANSLFGSTGGQSVDTSNSVFNSSFSPSVSQLDTNEVDPVAEADVYIAYGRDAQAEEILKEALRTQPERHAVRVKLLEIYSNRKDLRAFEVLATELYGLTNGKGEEWAQAAAFGIAIDPNNPLYANGKADMSGAPSALGSPTQPLDEQGLATLLATTQTDASDKPGGTLDTDSSYFGNTAMAIETPLEPVPEPEVPKTTSNDLDFDLDGLQDMAVPDTVPRPAPAEPPAELASIDFNFLDEPTTAPAIESTPEPKVDAVAEELPVTPLADLEFTLDDKLSETARPDDISLDNGGLDEMLAKAETPSDPLDFDLSSISLELPPVEPVAGEPPALELAMEPHELAASDSAEMTTKLDLAVAYREIGDKEGARELLDEVLKGGTPEQSERAKAMLLELA
jgi:pilus assembly protein FimV